jgi:hypothetical protein
VRSAATGISFTGKFFGVGYHFANNTMDLHGVDTYETKDEVFEYLPLLSEEAIETGLAKIAPVHFANNKPYSISTFYREGGQETLLSFIELKADGIRHVSCGRFTSIDEPERGLIEYYNASKDGVRRIGIPSNDSECIRMKFILDTSRLLLLYGLLHAQQFIPFRENKERNGDKNCLDRYVVSESV